MRVHDLIAIIPLIFATVDRSKMELKNQGRLDEWPTEIKKWSKLAFWMAARVEHIELYMQVQMWRIRRFHYGLRWIARWASILLAVAVIGVGGYSLLAIEPHRAILAALAAPDLPSAVDRFVQDIPAVWFEALLILTTAIASLAALYATYRSAVPDIDIVEQTLKTSAMQGFRDVRLHDQISEMLFREKMSLLHEEDKLKR